MDCIIRDSTTAQPATNGIKTMITAKFYGGPKDGAEIPIETAHPQMTFPSVINTGLTKPFTIRYHEYQLQAKRGNVATYKYLQK